MDTELIDTHTHAVSPDTERYPLDPAGLPGKWYVDAPHSAEQLVAAMDESGVARAVLVQGVGAYGYDNRYAADAANASPERLWSACCVDPHGPDAPGEFERLVREEGMRGIRLFALAMEGGESGWLASERGAALWRRAEMLDAQVIVTILYHQLGELRRALDAHPDVAVSLDHCAFPPLATPALDELDALLALSECANLHLKVSTNVLDAAVQAGAAPSQLVGRLAGAFGAGRLMWGSDFCQTHDRPYGELVQLGRDAFSQLPAPEQAEALGGTAMRLWSGAPRV